MAYIILPSRRTRQPQGAVRLNENNTVVKSLKVLDFGGYKGEQLSGRPLQAIVSESATTTFTTNGLAQTGVLGKLHSAFNLSTTQETTFFSFGRFLSAVQNLAPLVHKAGGANGHTSVGIHGGSDNYRQYIVAGNTTGWQLDYSVTQESLKEFHFQILTVSNAGQATAYYDKAVVGTGSISGGLVTRTDVSFTTLGGGYSAGTALTVTAQLLLGGVCDKAITVNEALDFADNPWQLFVPDPRRLYFGASGGGATTTTINAETGAFALTGAAATLNRGLVPLDAQPTSYAVSGTAATLARGWNLDAQPGTFAVSGTAATLARGWNLDAQPSTFAVSGTDATLARGWNLDAQPGAFELTGIAATLEYVQPGATTLDVQPGVFAVSGAAATLTYVQLTHYVIDAQPGTFTLTGVPGTLTYNQLNAYEITASPGTFSVTGADAALTYTLASIWTDINPASSIWTDIDPNTIWTGL